MSEISHYNPVRVDLNCKLKSNEPKITVKTQSFDDDEIISIRERIESSAVLSILRNIFSIDKKMSTINSVIIIIWSEGSPIIVTVHAKNNLGLLKS